MKWMALAIVIAIVALLFLVGVPMVDRMAEEKHQRNCIELMNAADYLSRNCK